MSEATTGWLSTAQHWPRAYGKPLFNGLIKQSPEDFRVTEEFSFEPSGSGEHVWLRIRKRKANTAQIAKLLARHASVSFRDVSYSGLKDFFAITEQWFSVQLPENKEVDWLTLNSERLSILDVTRHSKKLKRGTHTGNRFELIIRELSGDREQFMQRWRSCCHAGVPNYFGEQRFGRDFGNMQQAVQMFTNTLRIKDRNLRGLILSASRSWLFNECLANRVKMQSWQQLHSGEPAVLQGSESFFISNEEPDLRARLDDLDVHPSCPLWGEVDEELIENFPELHAAEASIVSQYSEISDGLIAARLAYGRRATRSVLLNPELAIDNEQLLLSFDLQKGQFATTVLRELLADGE